MAPVFTKNAIGRGAVWSVLNQSFGQILVLLVFLVTARFVSQEAFGIMAICLMVVEVFRQVAIESIGLYLTAKKDPTPQDYNACFIAIAVGGAVCAGMIFVFANPIAEFLRNADIADGLRWTSLLLLTTGLSKTHEVWLAKQLQFRILALRSMLSILVGGGIGIWMAIEGFGLLSLIVQQLLTAIVGTFTLWLATHWHPSLDTGWQNIRALFRYSRHVSINAVASSLNSQSDIFFSSYYLGAASTGVYNAGKRIITAVNLMLANGLNSVALPVQASLHGNLLGSTRTFLKSVSLTSFLAAPLFAGLAVLAGDVIHILLGSKWSDVAPVLAILAIPAYLFTLGQPSGNVLLVNNKPHWLTALGVINSVASIAMLMVFARYGLIALTWAYTAKTIVLYPLLVATTLHILKIDPKSYIAGVWPSISCAGIMAVALWGLGFVLSDWSAWARLLVSVPIGILTYTLSMMILGRKLINDFFSIVLHTLLKDPLVTAGKYVWRHQGDAYLHGGTKAMKDAHDILVNAGWTSYDTSYTGSASRKLIGLIISAAKLMAMPKESVFFVQLPQYGFAKRTLARLIIRRFKTIVLLHDIDKLRSVRGGTSEKLATRADYLISTGRLHEYLPLRKTFPKLVRLEAWDYLMNSPPETKVNPKGQVIYAGSINKEKSTAIFRRDINLLPLVLYGKLADLNLKRDCDIYMGPFNPDNPNIEIAVSWGLIWEGGREDNNALIGNNYEVINQPHKFSLYLACGIPVIVWRESFIAKYVEEHKCGIAVSSLEDIEKTVETIGKAEYEVLQGNAKKIGVNLRQGWALKKAIGQLGF